MNRFLYNFCFQFIESIYKIHTQHPQIHLPKSNRIQRAFVYIDQSKERLVTIINKEPRGKYRFKTKKAKKQNLDTRQPINIDESKEQLEF